MLSTRKIRGAFLVVAVCLSACAPHNPQATYDHAWSDFQHGDLVRAQQEAQRGYENFRSSPEWAWKFTIFKARILYVRGMYEDVLTQLSSEPSRLPAGELSVQKRRFEGMAYVSLHRFAEAEQKFG